MRNGKVGIEELKLIPPLLEEGKSYQEIAQHLRISTRALAYWIKRMKWASVDLKITRGRKPLNLQDLCQ